VTNPAPQVELRIGGFSQHRGPDIPPKYRVTGVVKEIEYEKANGTDMKIRWH
jgi:hypothetical protein